MAIQRYYAADLLPFQEKAWKAEDGLFILYSDHLEVVRKLEKEIKDLKKEMQRREDYIEGCLV